MHGSLKLGRVAGIEIRVHYMWLFAFILIAWSLAQGYFPFSNAGLEAATYWILGVASTLLLFGSVLVHELGHSLLAGARGLHVQSITLFIFGGVSSITKEASTAKDEFLIAVVGPLTSLALAGLFWLAGEVLTAGTASPLLRVISRSPISCSLHSTSCPGSRLTAGGCCGQSCGGRPATCHGPPDSPRMSARQLPSP
jgi:Zn-dependent protease